MRLKRVGFENDEQEEKKGNVKRMQGELENEKRAAGIGVREMYLNELGERIV